MDSSNTASTTQPRVLNENFENAAFTSELCQFLTNLAKTPGGEYNDLAMDLSRLREALLNEVETETNSSTRGNSSESEGKIERRPTLYSLLPTKSFSRLRSLFSFIL